MDYLLAESSGRRLSVAGGSARLCLDRVAGCDKAETDAAIDKGYVDVGDASLRWSVKIDG